MKKFYIILVLSILLSGCAAYKIQQGKSPHEGGFVVSRYNKVIPEYSIGVNNSFPGKEIAEKRFKRRRSKVEYYYKKIGFIDNRFKQTFVEPPLLFVQFVAGIFRMPFIAVSDYRYNHNPQYKEKMDKLEDEQYYAERARVKGLKDRLSEYIQEDLAKESPAKVNEQPKPKEEVKMAELAQEPVKEVPAAAPVEVKPVETIKPEAQEKAIAIQESLEAVPIVEEPKSQDIKLQPSLFKPTAIIIAKPQNGPSPLRVNFYGYKSSSPNGKIVSYFWDFGDGDKSNKPNPLNTYWSTTYGAREFTVTLTVTDNKGMASSSNVIIQVINK
ncbi:MAG: hypothetical protein COT38_01890 [Candidatus Omnitrophica bacterium CG08_land_8_20_14_0_20_41_16]|uniref:PKD domain-containing protein n=1 Tax=Candidatus Sherwoodlollariibacterium unditelluris TaxID=1974757 RepID=A0A2G9YKD0_9BACT|nr:MAG: hypothetical protein COX41_01435 [Candidatus Omnitrophica bacterium CG23_combo_of_CG06-09_8_20_14_all_41_10]PIS34097.1 MAG: hypothetical protein COT38_01890 [Candidatus Omnitrophica bacterium CG08_land_8_20_14_0_20_41_16]